MHRSGIFRAEYGKAAPKVDADLVGTASSRAQLHRWVSGGLKRLPYTDHCRVLEAMFPEWTADQLSVGYYFTRPRGKAVWCTIETTA